MLGFLPLSLSTVCMYASLQHLRTGPNSCRYSLTGLLTDGAKGVFGEMFRPFFSLRPW